MAEVKADTAQYSATIAGQVFQVLSISVSESMSQLYRFRLSLWSEDPAVSVKSMLRQPAELEVSWGGKKRKYFGIVAEFAQTDAGLPGLGGVDQVYGEYEAEVVPNLWVLDRKTNCRIFQELPTDQIVKQVLDGRGMAGKYEVKLSKAYPPREYCVQYRETDFAFISRLMEEEGIFYYFRHDEGATEEKMVLGDATSAYGTCAPEEEVEYKTGTGVLSTAGEHLSELRYEESAYTGKVKLRDFDYREPRKRLHVEESAADNTDLEIYDYHRERFRVDRRGRDLAKVMVEAQSAMRKTLVGGGTWRSAMVGCKLTLSRAYRSDLNGDWAVISASHSASQQAEGGVQYSVSFVAIPADTPFRPFPTTAQPSLNPQTAKVVGPSGEKIYMDELGRAKVQFHWDLEGSDDEDSSCWIRVAQPYAGIDAETQKKHGFQWHPLIGDEVVVDFLEGDPDAPLIVGSVYNGVNTPLVTPTELIRSRILSPYQHQLLFDDQKRAITLNTPYPHTLHMDDPDGFITLSTRYDNLLKMQDPDISSLSVPSVTLRTGGNETIRMEDKPALTADGNMIRVSTADGHGMLMAEGAAVRGISATTRGLHELKLDDKDEKIHIQTTSGHLVILDDRSRYVMVRTRDQHQIRIDDANRYIEVADSSGKHRFRVDIAGEKLLISTDTGAIDMLAPRGTITIRAQELDIKTDGDVKVDCANIATRARMKSSLRAMNIESKADMKHETTAMSIKAKATMDLKLEAMMFSSKGSVSNKTEGLMVTSEASVMNSIRGTLVKIN